MPNEEDGRAEGAPVVDTLDQSDPNFTPAEGSEGGNRGGEELEKLHKQIANLERFKSERDSLLTENKKLKDEYLAKIAEAVARGSEPKEKPLTQEEVNKRIKTIGKKINEAIEDGHGGEAVADLLAEYDEMRDRDYAQRSNREIAELKSQIEGLQSTLHEYDSEYVANKDKIGEWAEATGLDPVKHRKELLAIIKKTAKPAQPPRPQIPAAPGSQAITNASDDGAQITKEEWAAIDEFNRMAGLPPMTPEQRREYQKQRRR